MCSIQLELTMHVPWFSQLQTSLGTLDGSESMIGVPVRKVVAGGGEVVAGGGEVVVGRGGLQSAPSKHSHVYVLSPPTHVVFGGHCVPAQMSI